MSRIIGPQRAIQAINRCTRLEPKLRHALLAMVGWMDWDTFSLSPSLASLQEAFGVSRNTAMKRLNELERSGAVSIVRGGGGRGTTHQITLNVGWLEGVEPGLFGDQPTAQPTARSARRNGPPQGCTLIDQKGSNSDALRVQIPSNNGPAQGWTRTPDSLRKQPPPQNDSCAVPPDAVVHARGRGGGGGEFQTGKTKATPAAPTVRRVAEFEAKPTREGDEPTPRATVAINATRRNQLADEIEAIGPSPRVAAELAALPHVTVPLVRFIAEQAAKQKPNRPDCWAEKLLRLPPGELSQYGPWLRKYEAREAAIDVVRQRVIGSAIAFAHHHRDDAVYGRFCRAVLDAMRTTWPKVGDAKRDGQLPRELINPNASSLAVLRSLAAGCGHDIEIPTDTLRLPERDERGEGRQGATHAG